MRDSLSLNVNGSEFGSDGNILFRLYRFLFRTVVGTDVDMAFARLHRYAFIPGLDRLGNNDAALAGNSCNHISFIRNDVAFQADISIALHFEAGFVPRRKRSFTRCGSSHFFRQSTDVDATLRRNRLQRFDMDVVARLKSSAYVVDSFSDGHADIVSCLNASANAGERSVRAFNYNIMRRVGVAQQVHILIGLQDKIAFGAVSAKDFNFFILIRRIPYQNI